MSAVNRLYQSRYSRSNSKKFLLDSEQLVIKVGGLLLEKDIKIGNELKKLNIPTFLIPQSIFKYNDEYTILMPYMELGSIRKYKWNRDNFHIMKNVFKHIVASLFYAAITVGFTHSCLHPENVLLKQTALREISYGPFGTLPCIGGIIPIIMDFHMSNTDMVYALNLIYDISRIIQVTEIDINISYDTFDLLTLLNCLFSSGNLSPASFQGICREIDAMSVIRLKSERPPQIDFTKW